MKNFFLIALLTMLSIGAKAQNVTLYNNSGCAATFTIYAIDPSSCTRITAGTSFTVGAGMQTPTSFPASGTYECVVCWVACPSVCSGSFYSPPCMPSNGIIGACSGNCGSGQVQWQPANNTFALN